MDQRFIFGMFVIAVCAALQAAAWYCGINGAVFAFTSLIIGLTAGTLLGFSIDVKKSIETYVEQRGKE